MWRASEHGLLWPTGAQFCLIAVLLLLTLDTYAEGFRCKWSNEDCDLHDECCSGKCYLAHPGTNKRCTKSTLYGPCIFHYQCENRLKCSGKKYQCCSPYWGTCTNRTDCCDLNHLCVPADGFIYRRCLFQEVTSTARTSTEVNWAVTGIGVLLTHFISLLSLNVTFSFPDNITWISLRHR